MASLNIKLPPQGGTAPAAFEPSNTLRTHEGAPASHISDELQLRRSVCSCLLWESEFYESGTTIATRIAELVRRVPQQVAADLAIDAREHFNLRHVPLLLVAAMAAPGAGGSRLIGDTLAKVIQRPDEISEFLAVYAKLYGVAPNAVKKHLSAQVKKGLAQAFNKFDAYQLAKYFSGAGERGAVIRGRDVMFLTHPKPRTENQAELWRRVAAKEPVTEGGADTWEVALSSGGDKKETFERLLRDGKMGYLAVLRNLRNFEQNDVDRELVEVTLLARKGARRVLPFRYVAAARACPIYAQPLAFALRMAVADLTPLPGCTVVLVDVSGSMNEKLSSKSDLKRMDAAATLAAIIPGDVRVFTFSDQVVEITNAEPGFAMINAVIGSQPHSGTYLGGAISALLGRPFIQAPTRWYQPGVRLVAPKVEMDRLIVITDEQSHDHVVAPGAEVRSYMINVASTQNGVGYGPWVHLDGFSEQVLRFIQEFERLPPASAQ